jgi:DNA-3-methyladenine glycosylase II
LVFSVAAAEEHLRATDAVIAGLIERYGSYAPRRGNDPYGAVVRAIMFQQLSGKAAATIMRRLFELHGDAERVPAPELLLAMSDEEFRAVGVSRQKAGYLRDLALHMVDGRLDFDALEALPDEAVAQQLTAVKGVGEWTSHMFLMFQLGRPDVLPIGDLGVRNGMRVAYGLPAAPTRAEALQIGAAWAPYRSVGTWYMWRVVETETPL